MEKIQKEALQITKELVAKFIETRTISPGNFAEIFPAVYSVVLATISDNALQTDVSSAAAQPQHKGKTRE